MKRLLVLSLGLVASAAMAASPYSGNTSRIEWVDQFGTAGFDAVDDVTADSNYAYATGRVGWDAALPGQSSAGQDDAFLRKYDANGNVIWTRQFGTAGYDGYTTAAMIGSDVLIAGITTGQFPGQTQSGPVDIFLKRFTSAGDAVGTTMQFGTAGVDFPLALATDSSHIYMFGFTSDAFPGNVSSGGTDFFLAKLNGDGTPVWIRQFGTAADDPSIFSLGGIAVDESGGIYVASSVASPLPDENGFGGTDGFLRKYDPDGTVAWTVPIGTACTDLATTLTIQSDHLVVGGTTSGDLSNPLMARCTQPPSPYNDLGQNPRAFVQVRDLDGNLVWSKQYDGSGINDGDGFSLATAITTDENGIYVTGERSRTSIRNDQSTTCPVGGGGASEDVDVRAYDFDGNELWSQIIGTSATDAPSGIAVNASGVYVGGLTLCGLGGNTSSGSGDAFVLGITK